MELYWSPVQVDYWVGYSGITSAFCQTLLATVQLQGVPAAAPSMSAAPVPPPMYVVEEPVAAAFVGASVGASVARWVFCLGVAVTVGPLRLAVFV